jgi:hypothetical protein
MCVFGRRAVVVVAVVVVFHLPSHGKGRRQEEAL